MITPTPRLISFMINLSMPNPCPRRPHSATQNATGQRTEEVTAAYVAKLDSICAAAQAKVKNEIKAIPQQNQPAIIAARERVIRETMPELRGAPVAGGGLLALVASRSQQRSGARRPERPKQSGTTWWSWCRSCLCG